MPMLSFDLAGCRVWLRECGGRHATPWEGRLSKMVAACSFVWRWIQCRYGQAGWVALLWLVLLSSVQAGPALVFGLLPSESVTTKFRRYAPLREYLQKRLGQEVVLETARDFRAFRRRTLNGQYDLLETAPHFVPEAIDSGHYVVLTTIVKPLTAEVVVRADSPYRAPADLAGALVATPSPSAVITRIGKEALEAAGLVGPSAPRYVTFPTHNAAYAAVLGHAAEAALISVNVYNKARRQHQPLRSIGSSRAIPNMSILAARRLPLALRERLQGILAGMRDDPAGRRVLREMAYPGYRMATPEEFESLREYLAPLPAE